jgi:hypothetical protein
VTSYVPDEKTSESHVPPREGPMPGADPPPATVIDPVDREKMTSEFDWQSIPGESGSVAVMRLSPESEIVTLLLRATNGVAVESESPSKSRETCALSTVIELEEPDWISVRMEGIGEMMVDPHVTRDALISTSPRLMSQVIREGMEHSIRPFFCGVVFFSPAAISFVKMDEWV